MPPVSPDVKLTDADASVEGNTTGMQEGCAKVAGRHAEKKGSVWTELGTKSWSDVVKSNPKQKKEMRGRLRSPRGTLMNKIGPH